MNVFINNISAEFLKIKATPVYYFVVGCGLLIAAFLFIGNTTNVHDLSRIGTNPWDTYLKQGMIIFSIFMIIPMLVLLISTVLYIEQGANAYKLLYTLPTTRGRIYVAKLVTLLILVMLSCILVLIMLVLSGFILGIFYPEFELTYYSPNYGDLIAKILHTFISTLGIIGIQYLLSVYSKHVLVPVGMGFIGLIVGFILFVRGSVMTLYFPYGYPMVAQNLGLVDYDYRTIVFGNWLSNIELYSIIVFIGAVILGYIYETKRSVK